MAETFDVKIVSANVPALNNANRPLFKVPSGGGGITIVGADYVPGATTGTALPKLIDLGTSGTVNSGTIGSWGSVVATVAVPNALTITTAFVGAGHWVGVNEANTGSIPVDSTFSVSFVMGK